MLYCASITLPEPTLEKANVTIGHSVRGSQFHRGKDFKKLEALDFQAGDGETAWLLLCAKTELSRAFGGTAFGEDYC